MKLRGKVDTAPVRLDQSLYLELSVLSIHQCHTKIEYPGRIAVYIYSGDTGQYFDPPLSYGDSLSLNVYLEEPPHYGIPGVQDFRQLFWQRGLLHLVRIKSYRQIQRTTVAGRWAPKGALFRYRNGFERFCRDRFEPVTQRLILNVLFGQHRLLEAAEKTRLKKLGIFHLFVVSGFHVAVVVFFLHTLVRPLGPIGKALVLVGVWCYIVLAGGTLPTVRAGLMGSCSYLLLAFGISHRFLNNLGIAALLTLLNSPVSLYSASFQFSYLSLLAIGFCVLPRQPTLRSLWLAWGDVFSDRLILGQGSQRKRRRHTRYLLEAALEPLPRRFLMPCLRLGARLVAYFLALAICSWFVQLATLPLSLYYSNLWIWTQWLANLILMPCFALFLIGSLLLFVSYWLPLVSALAAALAVFASSLDRLIEGLASATLVSYLPQPGGMTIGLYFLLLSCCCWRTRKWRMLAWVSPGVLLLPCLLALSPTDKTLQVTVLDVGQGGKYSPPISEWQACPDRYRRQLGPGLGNQPFCGRATSRSLSLEAGMPPLGLCVAHPSPHRSRPGLRILETGLSHRGVALFRSQAKLLQLAPPATRRGGYLRSWRSSSSGAASVAGSTECRLKPGYE